MSQTPTPPTTKSSSICEICENPCNQSCSICRKVNYCSKEHQKSHWKVHKPSCFPGIIKSNQVVGRHLVSTRLIKPGEIILKERPIISGPSGKSGSHPICLSCYRIPKDTYFCSKCKWPMCNQACENEPNHANHECKVFSKNYMRAFNPREVHMYEKIFILRCLLLKETNPKNWAKIMDLQSNREQRHNTKKGKLLSTAAIQFIQKVCLLPEIDEKDIDYVLGVLGTNAFVTEDNLTSSPSFRSGSFLYYYASFPAHNCIPNSKWTIQMNSEFHLIALKEIKAGEQITQLYTQATVGTNERRIHLMDTKYFSCSCERCADPTEMGTYFSGVKCTFKIKEPCPGFLLPLNPLDNSSIWKCSNKSCTNIKKVQGIDSLLEKLREEYNKISNENSLTAIDELNKVLSKYVEKLHPNHYLVHEIQQDILQRCSYLLAKSSTENISRKQSLELAQILVDLSKKSLAISDKIFPGLSTHRGRQMYFLQQGLTVTLYDKVSKTTRKKLPNSGISKQIEELKEIRRTGAYILGTESEAREEFILANYMRDDETNKKLIEVLNL